MIRSSIASFLVVITGFAQVSAQEAKGPQWTVLAIHIEREDDDDSYYYRVGTKVTAALHLPMRSIVGIDPKESKLISFTDDKNTDLLVNPKNKSPRPVGLVDDDTRITTDGEYCRVVYRALAWPAPGSNKIRVRGSLAVLVGKGEQIVERKDVALPLGLDFPGGALKTSKSGLSNYLSYSGDQPLKNLALLDGNGKEIAYRYAGYYNGGPPAKTKKLVADYRYLGKLYLNGPITRCTVRAVLYQTVEKITVPVEFEAGLGLGE